MLTLFFGVFGVSLFLRIEMTDHINSVNKNGCYLPHIGRHIDNDEAKPRTL